MDAIILYESRLMRGGQRASSRGSVRIWHEADCPERQRRRNTVNSVECKHCHEASGDSPDTSSFEIPVRDTDYREQSFTECTHKPHNNVPIYHNNTKRLFTVFEMDHSLAVTRNDTPVTNKQSVELQTDVSSDDNFDRDLIRGIVKNILHNLASEGNHSIKKEDLEVLVDKHYSRCCNIVRKIITNILADPSGTSTTESSSKEEEVTSYNYNCKSNSESQSHTTSTSVNELDKKSTKCFDDKDDIVTYQVIKELLKKCVDVKESSEINCTIERNSDETTTPAPVLNEFNGSSCATSTVKVKSLTTSKNGDSEKAFDTITKSPRKKKIKVSASLCEKDTTNTNSRISNRSIYSENDMHSKGEESNRRKLRFEKSVAIKTDRDKNINENKIQKRASAKEGDVSVRMKFSDARNKLRLDDSENFEEKQGFMAKLCSFLCRKFYRS